MFRSNKLFIPQTFPFSNKLALISVPKGQDFKTDSFFCVGFGLRSRNDSNVCYFEC